MPLTDARIGVLVGGASAEREISFMTGRAVHQALLRRGYDAVLLDVDASLPQQLLERKIDIAFVALHGPGGEDGTVQGLLEIMKIPYTGSSVRASAIAMHKHAAKALLDYHGIPVPRGVLIRARQATSKPSRGLLQGLKWPVVVKPATQGSTFGITVVRRASEWADALRLAHQYDEEALAEPYVPGHEVTVSILGTADRPQALPTVEIVVPGGFYDYSAKYEKGRSQYLCPAPLPRAIRKRVEEYAIRAYVIVGCDGAARVDFRVTPRGRPYVLEINTVPGMTETSLLPMAAAKAGLDYDSLTERILESALRRVAPARPSPRGG